MEAQLHRPTTHDHHREEDLHHNAALHSVMEGEGEAEHDHHGEKKSVLKKVKDKAKKLKNTITKHGGHAHERDVDDDEDEETVVDSDVHGGPMVSEADFISGTALPKQTGLNLENQTSPPLVDRQTPSVRNEVVYDDVGNAGVDREGPNIRNEVYPNIGDDAVMKNSASLMEDPYIPNIGEEEEYSGVGGDHVGRVFKTSPPLEDPYIPNIRKEDQYYSSGVGDVGVTTTHDRGEVGRLPVDAPMTDLLDPLPASTGPIESERRANVAEPVVKIGPLADLEKDPHAPGAGATPPPNYQTKVVDPTGQGGREAEVAPLVERLGNLSVGDKSEPMPNTGSHDQFAPTNERFNPESFDSESMPRDTVAGKISSVTSVIADKATSAKNAVASGLGYGSSTQEGQEPSKNTTALGSLTEYGHTVAEKLAPVYGKAAGAGSAIMSKVQSRGGGGDGVVKESDKGASVQGYLAEKFSPGEEDKELSKVITDAIHRKKEGARGAGEEQPVGAGRVKESVKIEAVCSDEKTAAGVVDRVKGAIGSWLGSKGGRGQQQGYAGEGLDKEEVSRLQESGN